MQTHTHRRLSKSLAYGGALLACLAVFGLYTQPQLLVTLAQQLWACF